MTQDRWYEPSPGVRVRKEEFGLLFYNSKDAKLTFVRSGKLLNLKTDPDGRRRVWADGGIGDREGRVGRIFEALLKKGLLFEARSGL